MFGIIHLILIPFILVINSSNGAQQTFLRKLLSEQDGEQIGEQDPNIISVMSYNILSPTMSTHRFFKGVNDEYLDPNRRKKLIFDVDHGKMN